LLTLKSLRIKWIKDDIASIDVVWESVAHKTPDHGQSIPNIRLDLLNLIARKEAESGIWKIVVGHNVEYTKTYSQINRQRIIEQKKS
jgi:hypothetical protein